MKFFDYIKMDATTLARANNKLCRFLNMKFNNCHIMCNCPSDLVLEHQGSGVIIGSDVIIGNGVVIYHNVTIGKKVFGNNGNKYPSIGDNVTICSNSIILGDIHIGNNSIIGAGTFVNKDISKNSLVFNKKEIVVKKI